MTALPTLCLVRDLIFGSRISAVAAGLDLPVRTVRDPARLAGEPGDQLIVDLNLPGAIEAAAAWKAERPGRLAVGFVSHVDVNTIRTARERGIDHVMARSRFVTILPDLLRDGIPPSVASPPPDENASEAKNSVSQPLTPSVEPLN